MDDDVFKISDQIKKAKGGFRHVVILGAGASKASCRDNRVKRSTSIPLMHDLTSIIDLSEELHDLPNNLKEKNFEAIFSELHETEANSNILLNIEKKIYDFFSKLELPDTPTIYDYLILSLRKKDLIATFNWDPFLWQAYERNRYFTNYLPQLVFLHGNVSIGIDEETKSFGPVNETDRKSGKSYVPTKLLYPIKHKDYSSDLYIQDQWNKLSHYLKSPVRVTIFGYSAPTTDIEAITILKKAWGNPARDKPFTQFEIIDIQDEDSLTKSWKDFIFSHHYEITKDFFKSSIVRFPRRTGEVFEANILEGKWYEENYPPKFNSIEEMWMWYAPFLKAE